MTITSFKFERFTAFEELAFEPSPGINILVGANGTGKTHLMKAAYAACDVSKTGDSFAEKLISIFMPSGRSIGRLVKRRNRSARGAIQIFRHRRYIRASFSNHATVPDSAHVTGAKGWAAEPLESVYIPVKEMLANAPGFRSLYAQREIHFEEIYADILDRAYRPFLRGPADASRRRLLEILRKAIDGRISVKNEEFYHNSKQGSLEFTLLAEGLRKLGLLWLLIQNGVLQNGSVLFWDEPETNLNPKLFGPLIGILLELQRSGVQIFIATHDYAILKEFDLQRERTNELAFHSLYRRSGTGDIECYSARNYIDIHPNAIGEAFADLYDREVRRSLEGLN